MAARNKAYSLTPLIAIALFASFLGACAHPTSTGESPDKSDKSEKPEKAIPQSNGKYETLAIVGLNDMHGALAPERLRTRDANAVAYERGGAAMLAGYLKVLRNEYGSRLLLLDAGDEFSGSLDSNRFEGKPVVEFYRSIGLSAATLGHHDFDFGAGAGAGSNSGSDPIAVLRTRIGEANYPYLAANLYTKKGEFPGVPGTQSSVILNAGSLKVGIIGLVSSDSPLTTRDQSLRTLDFRDLSTVAIAEAKKLRAAGAQIVIALAHAGVLCEREPLKMTKTHAVKSEDDPQTNCNDSDEVPRFLRKLPRGTVDAVISGHTHSLVHHWIGGVPVLQSGTRNYYFTTLYLSYDRDAKRLDPDQTRIEGPTPVCGKVFANQRDCSGELPAPRAGRGELVTPTFHNAKITADSSTENLLAPTFEKTADAKREVVGKAGRALETSKREESAFGDLVADAVRESVKADVAIVNEGSIREGIAAGDIRYEDLFRALPYGNTVSLVTVTGKQLKGILRVATNGWRGYFPVSNLRLHVIDSHHEPEKEDWNGDGKSEYWEVNRLIRSELANGDEIRDEKEYRLATIDYLVLGGDGMEYPMAKIPKGKIELVAAPSLHDAVAAYIRKRGTVNTEADPILRADAPRILGEAPPHRSSKSSRRRKRRK